MNRHIRRLVLAAIPKKLRNYIFYNHPEYLKQHNGQISFAQEGEDMVLKRIFGGIQKGFYVDIGAHHPTFFSNTNYFYQRGWRGINIEPISGSKAIFDLARPNDINLEILVSEADGPVEYYLFEPSLMNTISRDQVEENKKFKWCKLKEVTLINSVPLNNLLNEQLPDKTIINFMSIDVEGAEMAVLRSNNWKQYKPQVLLIELIDKNVEQVLSSEIHNFLSTYNYIFFAKTGNTVFYKQKGFFEF